MRFGGLTSISAIWLAGVILLAVFGPMISPWEFDAIDWERIGEGPSRSHWFGTDTAGRDLFVRTFTGARVSFAVALLATLVTLVIGIPWGAAAGYVGGRVGELMMRIVDVLYALPFVFVVILLVVVFGRNLYLLFLALGALSWLDLARIVRGQTLSLKHETFVAAARAQGASAHYIVARHVIPNLAGPALVFATLTVPGVMLAESFLSFLGLGVQEPDTSWGVLIADGAREMESSPWLLAFPAAFLATTLWCLNHLGDRLRDALDPKKPRSGGSSDSKPRSGGSSDSKPRSGGLT
jgi:oligopeptide transport system permease protein